MTAGNTQGHAQREYRRVEVHASGRVHPERTTLVCEAPGCDQEISLAASYSFVITMATTGPAPNPAAFQCGDEQHFCCSPACARAAALVCMDHQLAELAARRAQLEGADHGNE